MKVAKNMDSVFASCTQDELDFDAFFDKDDCLIDMVAGVDEAGNLITGDYVDIDKIIEAAENEMVGEKPDFDYQKDGDVAYSLKDAEGTKNVNPKIGGEVGNQPSLAKQDSAESNADDTKDEEEAIGANDKQQTSLEASDPLTDDDEAEREGETSPTAVDTECNEGSDTVGASIDGDSSKDILKDDDDADLRNGSVKEDDKNIEGVSTKAVAGEGSCPNCGKSHDDCSCSCNESAIDRLANSILESIFDSADLDILVSESDDPIEDNCDTGERAGAIKHDTSEVEGKDAEPIGAAVKGIDHSDILKDDDDADLRDGSAKEDDKNIEGVSSKVIEAAGNDSAEDKAAIDAEKQDEPNEQDDQNVETESIDIELEEEYDITLEADDCEDCDKNATQTTNEEDAPANNGGASEPANEEDAPTDGGDSSDSTNESIDIELEEEYDINIDKEFSDDIAAVDGADETIPDNVQVSDSSNDIKPDRDRDSFKESGLFGDMLSMLESSEEDAVADDEDDALIDMIKNDKADVEDVELDYSYDDDELIDMVASGAVDKIDEE